MAMRPEDWRMNCRVSGVEGGQHALRSRTAFLTVTEIGTADLPKILRTIDSALRVTVQCSRLPSRLNHEGPPFTIDRHIILDPLRENLLASNFAPAQQEPRPHVQGCRNMPSTTRWFSGSNKHTQTSRASNEKLGKFSMKPACLVCLKPFRNKLQSLTILPVRSL